MATFTVWRFDSAEGAGETLTILKRLQKAELIHIDDAAIVSWPQGAKKPTTEQLSSIVGTGALGGVFWGLLFGLLFFIPLIGMAIRAAAGAIGGARTDVGNDDAFMHEARPRATPATSAP